LPDYCGSPPRRPGCGRCRRPAQARAVCAPMMAIRQTRTGAHSRVFARRPRRGRSVARSVLPPGCLPNICSWLDALSAWGEASRSSVFWASWWRALQGWADVTAAFPKRYGRPDREFTNVQGRRLPAGSVGGWR
jgi:hypothetical protein